MTQKNVRLFQKSLDTTRPDIRGKKVVVNE